MCTRVQIEILSIIKFMVIMNRSAMPLLHFLMYGFLDALDKTIGVSSIVYRPCHLYHSQYISFRHSMLLVFSDATCSRLDSMKQNDSVLPLSRSCVLTVWMLRLETCLLSTFSCCALEEVTSVVTLLHEILERVIIEECRRHLQNAFL